ncbi:MAG: AI-2E family transporter [bacterium]|nr:AI-2E family transporter [bacterium]
MEEKIKLEISWWAIAKLILAVLGVYFLYQVRDILVLMFVVFVFVAALNPIVSRFQKRMPRLAAVTIIFICIFLVLLGTSALIFQPLVIQANALATIVPEKLKTIIPVYNQFSNNHNLVADLSSSLQQFSGTLANLSGNLITATFSVFGGIFTILSIFVLTFYLLLEEQAVRQFVDNVVAPNYKQQAGVLLKKIGDKMGAWVRGQLLLMLVIGILYLILLLALGIQAPLPLALWGGLTEVIPYLGPILGGAAALVVALITGTPLQALLVVVGIIVIQQLENQFLVPKIMQRAVGLSPVVVILALLIGSKIFGIVGGLLAIPVAAIVALLAKEWSTFEKALNR